MSKSNLLHRAVVQELLDALRLEFGAMVEDVVTKAIEKRGLLRAPAPQAALKVYEAARYIGVSRSRLYELMAAGQIPSFLQGRSRLFAVADLDAWISKQLEEQKVAKCGLPATQEDLKAA